MKKYFVLLSLLLGCFIPKMNCQNTTLNKTIIEIKKHQYKKATQTVKKLNKEQQVVFNKWLAHYLTGRELDTLGLKKTKNAKYNNLINLYLGNYYFIEKHEDSIAYKYYLKAKVTAKKNNDTLLINASLLKLCDIQFIVRNDNILNKYIKEIKKYKKDSIDHFYYHYFKIISLLNKNYKLKQNNIPSFDTVEIYSVSSIFSQAELYSLKGHYYNTFVKNKIKSLEEFQKAIDLYSIYKNYYSKNKINDLKINIARSYFYLKQYKKAIVILEKSLKNVSKNDIVVERVIKYWLSKSYDSLKKTKKAYNNLIDENNLVKKLALDKHAKKIIELENTATINNQKQQIETQIAETNTLKLKMNTILPILAIITLLLGIVFILYKKYYKKTEVLEEEKSEVVKKIDKLTEIVIKNHIVLKDKTKVYVADLMYIKSDDHFLKVFLSNGKNHFVRGKLYKMVEELPPNFIRCHRSYIINRNFIKQVNNTHIILVDKTEIPLARAYKDKF